MVGAGEWEPRRIGHRREERKWWGKRRGTGSGRGKEGKWEIKDKGNHLLHIKILSQTRTQNVILLAFNSF